jgi:DNA-binding CsgD family transcriptional regulator
LLGLLVTGASDEWIAVAMGISTDAVARHLDRVGAKLVASSRNAAAARALRLGMFVPSSFFVRDCADGAHTP